MKAITCRSYGVLRLEEVDEPVPGADNALVDVQAASVNAADWHFVRGAPYNARLKFGLRRPTSASPVPTWPGRSEPSDLFGTSFRQGFRRLCRGDVVPERLLARKPATVPFDQAAAISLA